MDSDILRKGKNDSDFEVTGVSRSGRVRKKSSKLLDFESPDDIESRPRKIPVSRPTGISHPSHRTVVREPEPESDVDIQNDTKSETEEMEGGSSDSDYYDPTLDNQDSLDSMDSEDMGLSDVDNSFNSSGEHANRSVMRPGNSLYFMERSSKRKSALSDFKDSKSKSQRRDRGGNKSGSSYLQNHSTPLQPRSSSRNRHSNIKSSSLSNSLSINMGGSLRGNAAVMYVDVGAHLRLLGESLAIIGERLKEHEGQIAVSGSVSVLLDTLLCSLVPLICLTAHLPSIAPPLPLLHDTLDNIAYIMPGL
ncbi:uncharacterized protein LOC143913120 [Arctopsyche grandis]|uniref:uncharacterized protein LOC143913120 n=1 Tax=Arctopsyche grandis TaxID=121162 RepID=UPI00406DA4B9